MTRYVFIRTGDMEHSVPETPLPREANLHDAITTHPELLPAEDLGLGRVVVVGRESSLSSVYADLLLVDESGQPCLVEIKKEGNPDTRRVVAQLFDYAGALWGMGVDEFEDTVLFPYLRSLAAQSLPTTIREFLAAAFAPDGADE